MITKAVLRACVSPALVFTFVVVSVTGFLLLFGIDHVDDLHKWVGLAFAVAGVMHLAINWRAFVPYFHGRKVVVWGAAMLLICAVLLIGIGDSDRDRDDNHKRESTKHVRGSHDD